MVHESIEAQLTFRRSTLLHLQQSSADFSLGLIFNPEDGNRMFLRNIAWLSKLNSQRYVLEDRRIAVTSV
jgi:hypothetical protein